MTIKHSGIIKKVLSSVGLFAHCAFFNLLFFWFYVAYGLTPYDPFTPLIVIASIIPIINIFCLIILASKTFIHKISVIIAFIANSTFSSVILIWVLDTCNFALDENLDSLHYLIVLIVSTAIVVFGSLLSVIIRFKKTR